MSNIATTLVAIFVRRMRCSSKNYKAIYLGLALVQGVREHSLESAIPNNGYLMSLKAFRYLLSVLRHSPLTIRYEASQSIGSGVISLLLPLRMLFYIK
jgi:hypothetical protein